MKELLTLAIESTAHTFAIAILKGKKILADARSTYKTEKGGMIPIEVARHHEDVKNKLLEEALNEAKLKLKDIELIVVANAPGLPPCLKIGVEFAKKLARENKIDIIGVNHCVSHLISGHLFTDVKNPVYIFVSGANTQIISLEDKRFRIIGETLDIAIGNALDKFGREIGLGFPAGPEIERLAKNGMYIELPYTVKGMDLSFSGIVTDALNKFKKNVRKEDLCFSFQETAFAMLVEVVERALAHTDKDEAVLIGGVAANKRLIEMLEIMCKERGAKFYVVPLKYSGDQAVMHAYLGQLMYKNKTSYDKLDFYPYQRTDEVLVDFL